MARIRYIGDQLIARAFERTFHRNHWDEEHGLQDHEIAVLSLNPQFDVDGLGDIPVPSKAASSPGRPGGTPAGCRQ